MNAVVTGAGGFVGQALLQALPDARPLSFGAADWQQRLTATDLRDATIFHLAARVHRPGDGDESAYQRDNMDKTVALANAAAAAGARVLVFASTIKVNGEETRERAFTATDVPAPGDAYGRSKRDAEKALAAISARTGLPVHVVRSPLVYGPRVSGNLRSLLALCDTPVPLPFGAVRNRRSFIAVDDLARLLLACARHADRGITRTWLAAHPEPISTAFLVATLRDALGRPHRLVPIPPSWLEVAGTLLGRGAQVRRLVRSLEVDARATTAALDWTPRVGLAEVVAQLVAGYRAAPRP